ncbi:MAG: hypothetical protein HC817_11880, partial [Saprospiraceae bacterium]|nr:hypothetical protein [Saprospiraceae bacterium]
CDALGSITLSVTGGNGGYRYTWADAPSLNTPIRENLKANTYNATITDAAGCTRLARNIIITDSCACRPAVVDSLLITNANCGTSNGAATILLRNGNETNYTYTWSPSVGTSNATGNGRTNLSAGLYTVTATAKNNANCVSVLKIGVGTVEGPQNVRVDVVNATCDMANGGASITINSATEPHNFSWLIDGKTSSSRNDLKAGVYQVQIARASNPNCVTMAFVRIGSTNNLQAFATIGKNPACGAADGSATIRVSGGSGNYSYSWGSNNIRNDLKSGIYAVTATDLTSNCKAVATFTLTDQVLAEVFIEFAQPNIQLNCNGNRNGRLDYNITYPAGFARPATVVILDGKGRVYNNGELPIGSYCLVVKDAQGCVAGSKCFEVREPLPLSAGIAATDFTCATPGRMTLTSISGGTAPYQYQWNDNPQLANVADRTGLNPGTYSITVYDAKGCAFPIENISVKNNCPTFDACALMTVTATPSDRSCTEGGKISLNIKGGFAPYTFDWADLAGVSNGQNRFELEAGTYTVIVTDATGCQKSANVAIKNNCSATCIPPVITIINLTDATCGKANGAINVAVVRPSGALISWTPSLNTTSPVVQNVAAGVYQIKATDPTDATCAITRDIVIKNADGIQVGTPTISPATCGSSNGRVEFSSTGKTLNYVWSDGGKGSVRTSLPKGFYTVTITDPANPSCPQFASVDVNTTTSTMIAAAIINKKATCGQSDGQATISVIGGSGSYSYSWGSASRTNLRAAPYSVTVTDNSTGCQAITTFVMTENASAIALINIPQPIINLVCGGEKNATVVYNVTYSTGFAQPATIRILNSLGQTAKNDSLGAGRYSIFIYDKNQCLAGIASFEVREPQPLSIVASVAPKTCTQESSVKINVSGGSGVFNYKWSDLGTATNQPNQRLALAEGIYTITVADSRGCNTIIGANVRNEAFSCNGTCDLSASAKVSAKTCTEGGKIDLTIQSGSGNYRYQWSDLGATTNQPRDRAGIEGGIYTVTITNLTTNCLFTLKNIIVENKAIGCNLTNCVIEAAAEVVAEKCTEGGLIRVKIVSGASPFVYDWLDIAGEDNPQNRTNLAAGQYTVVVRDSIGCRDTLSNLIVIDSCSNNCITPVITNVSVVDASCGQSSGQITLEVLNTGYTYTWSPNVSSSNTATGLAAGVYRVKVARINDPICFVERNIIVNNANTALSMNAPTVKNATCGASNGEITMNGQSAWVYRWSDGGLGKTRTNLPANVYFVTVTDPSVSLCPLVQQIEVKSVGGLQASARVDVRPSCGQANGQATISVSGGSSSYTYSWGANDRRTDLAASSYNVTVSDNQTGCSAIVSINVTEQTPASATIQISNPIVALKCLGDQNGFVNFTVTPASGFALPASSRIVDAN